MSRAAMPCQVNQPHDGDVLKGMQDWGPLGATTQELSPPCEGKGTLNHVCVAQGREVARGNDIAAQECQ